MFSTDFIFRQQENFVDNQKCQAGFRPLCNKILYFSEKLRGMREHLCLKVKALEHTVRISDTSLGFSDLLMNADNKG